MNFYPRSPCGERHAAGRVPRPRARYFYPRSPCGERHTGGNDNGNAKEFLSTLSLRRATRHEYRAFFQGCISIHALLAESDKRPTVEFSSYEISIHALLAESDANSHVERQAQHISIHALLAESDIDKIPYQRQVDQFLSTLSLRRATKIV